MFKYNTIMHCKVLNILYICKKIYYEKNSIINGINEFLYQCTDKPVYL